MDIQLSEKIFYTNTILDKCTGLLNERIIGDYDSLTLKDFFLVCLQNSITNNLDKHKDKISGDAYSLSLYSSLKHIDKEIRRLYSIVNELKEFMQSNNGMVNNGLMTDIFHLKMNIINMVKRFIDDLISLSYMTLSSSEEKLRLIETGDIIRNKNGKYDNIFLQKINYETFEMFFKAINDYNNSFKHSIYHFEASFQISPFCENGHINLVSYKLDFRGNKVKYLSSYFKQIVQGFNDFLEVFCDLKKSDDVEHKYMGETP